MKEGVEERAMKEGERVHVLLLSHRPRPGWLARCKKLEREAAIFVSQFTSIRTQVKT